MSEHVYCLVDGVPVGMTKDEYIAIKEARIAELEEKNADVKFELDAALGWYEKWQKIASDRSKEILRLMEVESESKRKDEVLVWDADKILECTTRIVEQSERIAELEAVAEAAEEWALRGDSCPMEWRNKLEEALLAAGYLGGGDATR